ncbi:MAG: EAL domain-containing protein [Pseudolabrys sp.]|jgi:EAL domain-containing protein (putative c-di-GMP-specific phosphodiesterase class I)
MALDIWYQPKVDLKRKCLAGAEAHARIADPQAQSAAPEDAIAAADKVTAQIIESALVTILQDWTTFAGAGFNLHLAMNVPARILSTLPVAEIVKRHRPANEAWPGLILEVREDQIVRDVAAVKKIAAGLRAAGVSIAIDDFGAGYSALSILRDLPFSELKLGGAFVQDCATDATNAAICQTAIDLAHRFNGMAVAEGIASMADLQALVVMGCNFGQGPLLGPPMARDQFLELLRLRDNIQRRREPATPVQPAEIATGRVA